MGLIQVRRHHHKKCSAERLIPQPGSAISRLTHTNDVFIRTNQEFVPAHEQIAHDSLGPGLEPDINQQLRKLAGHVA